MKQSSAWKNLERATAKELGGYRVTRGADFGVSDVDVIVPDYPNVKVDCKRRKQNFVHHGMLKDVRDKYCFNAYDMAILVTKNHNQTGAVASLSLYDLGRLFRLLRKNNIPLESGRGCGNG